MKAKIARWGNSVGVRFPKPIAQELDLTPGREVDLRQSGSRVTIETAPPRKLPVYKLKDLLAQIKPDQKQPPFEDWGILETEWPNEDWSDVAPSEAEWQAWKKEATLKPRPRSKPKGDRKRGVSKRRRA